MFTTTQIDGATGEALTRMSVKIQDASLEDGKDTNAKLEASMAVQDAELVKQTAALGRVAAALEAQAVAAGDYLEPSQRLWLELYQTHLKTRREPAIITSATGDPVVKDVVLDAVMMTNEVFGAVRASIDALRV